MYSSFLLQLGVVIAKTARNVTVAEAHSYIFEYTIVNDVSARLMELEICVTRC